MEASIRNGVHYIDTAAELDSFRLAATLGAEAKAAGITLLPGGGGSVAMLGSLAGHAVAKVRNSQDPDRVACVRWDVPGSAISATENMAGATLACVEGALVTVANSIRTFDFGQGAVDSFQVTLPDLITIWRATRVPNIETFVHVTGDGFPQGDLSLLPEGPSEEERLANRYQAIVKLTDAQGKVFRSLLDTVNGYSFTAIAVAEAGRRVLAGKAGEGFRYRPDCLAMDLPKRSPTPQSSISEE